MKKIILDTNFLLIPFQFKVDIFSEIERICDFKYEIFILDKTVDELEKIKSAQKGKDKEAAGFALSLIEARKIKKIKTYEDAYVDSILLMQKDAIIATQDMALKRMLKKNNIRMIFLKQKKYLALL